MSFFKFFSSANHQKRQLQTNEIDSLFSYLKRLINREDLAQGIIEQYQKVKFLDKSAQPLAYTKAYILFDDFITSHKPLVVKREFTKDSLRADIAGSQDVNLLPIELALLFFEEKKKLSTFFRENLRPLERYLINTFGTERLKVLTDKINSIVSINLKVSEGGLDFFELENSIKNDPTVTTGSIVTDFKTIYNAFYFEIREYLGETVALNLYSGVYASIKDTYGFDLLSRFLELMPLEIQEKEKISLLSRKQLEEAVYKRTEELASEKGRVEEKVKERTFELTLEKEKLDIVTENMLEGSILLNESFDVIFTNEKARKILAFTKETSEKALLYFQQATKVDAVEKLKSENEKEKITEVNIADKIYEITFGTIKNGNRIKNYLVWLRDITQFKLLEVAKSEFVSVAAHQLRTPLSGNKWILHMLAKGEIGTLTVEQKSFIMKAYESNERMITLVNDLLNAERIDSNETEYKMVPVQIFDLIENILLELKPKIEKGNLKIIKEKGGVPPVSADGEKMRLVFQNLLENAVKYTMSGGAISISGEAEDGFVKVRIADTGIGIPVEQQGNIFKRFYRATNAVKIQTDGSGLGLFLVKTVVERHGGAVWFESTEGKGTVFFVKLPILQKK